MEEKMSKGSKAVNRYVNQQPKKSNEQIAYEARESRIVSELAIKFMKRELAYKENQIKTGIIEETRATNRIPGQPAIILDGFIDGKKPMFIIENEKDQCENHIRIEEEKLKNIEDQNARRTTKS